MWRMTVIMLMSIALGACIMFPQQEPEEFAHAEKSIQIGKSTKAEVIELLGEPQWEDPIDGSLYYSGKVVGQTACGIGLVPTPMIIAPVPWCDTGEPENWWMKIGLDENEAVTSVETKMEEEATAELAKLRKARREIRRQSLVVRAKQGDSEAVFTLAKDFDDLRYLKVLAEGGDVGAAIEVAKLRGDLAPLSVLAEKGNSTAALELYRIGFERRTSSEALKWLCVAANAGNGEAQSELGWWHRTEIWSGLSSKRKSELREIGIEPNDQSAYMWYTLAIKSGDQNAAGNRTYVVKNMAKEEIAQAEQMVRDWKPADCPSAEHRLGPPEET